MQDPTATPTFPSRVMIAPSWRLFLMLQAYGVGKPEASLVIALLRRYDGWSKIEVGRGGDPAYYIALRKLRTLNQKLQTLDKLVQWFARLPVNTWQAACWDCSIQWDPLTQPFWRFINVCGQGKVVTYRKRGIAPQQSCQLMNWFCNQLRDLPDERPKVSSIGRRL